MAPSDSQQASRFLAGCKPRAGERVKRDAAATAKQALATQDLCEEEHDEAVATGSLTHQQQEVCEVVAFFTLPFSCSLQGFKVPKIALRALLTKAQLEDLDEAPAHVAVPVRGKLKARVSRVTSLLAHAASKLHLESRWALGPATSQAHWQSAESHLVGYFKSPMAHLGM